MRLGIAADHEGFELKEKVLGALRQLAFQVTDFGAFELKPDDDYPDFVVPLAKAVADGELDRGIAICGSGVGASIAANKVKNVRAGLVHDLFSARQGVEDDDMNLICIGARVTSFDLSVEVIRQFLESKFSQATRHKRRLAKITKIEETWQSTGA